MRLRLYLRVCLNPEYTSAPNSNFDGETYDNPFFLNIKHTHMIGWTEHMMKLLGDNVTAIGQ